jgi:perosamine synthetase
MHEQPVLRKRGLFAGETYPVTERIARRGLYLPSGLNLDEREIDTICMTVRRCLA